jgi:hypothetical protein
MPPPIPTDRVAPGAAPDGTRDQIVSGVWVAKPFVPIDAFPEALVLTAADRKLAPGLAAPACLERRTVGVHVVEILLERGEDRSVGLSLRIPTAENQFKDPYILMEAEPGNTREVGVREVQFHLQGRIADGDLARADWAAFFAAAARALEALRAARAGSRARPAAGKKRPAPKRRASPRRRAAPRKRAARKAARSRR